jgi:hypothetical protein
MSASIALRSSRSFLRPVSWNARTTDNEVEHVVVIAGPFGSGKSTFMREFVADRLPRSISDYIPAQAKTWKRTSGNELTRKGLRTVLSTKGHSRGLVLHYDIMRVLTQGFDYHSDDPALKVLARVKAQLTVLTILPSRETLFEQFLERARDAEYEEWWGTPKVVRRLRRRLRARFLKFIGKSPKFLKEGHLELLKIYASDALLNAWIGRWETYLKHIGQARDDVRLIYVAPDASADGHPRFRLLRCF